MSSENSNPQATADAEASSPLEMPSDRPKRPEIPDSGISALQPTRFGDWERSGRCIDF